MNSSAKTRQRGLKGFLYWWLEAENIIYTLKLISLSDNSPKTIIGRIFASPTFIFANIAFIGFFISIISSKMGEIMDNIKTGKKGNLHIQDHIVLCGCFFGIQRTRNN